MTAALPSRFWSKVDKTATCWLWTGTLSQGYGKYAVATHTMRYAHRVAYAALIGPIPDGLVIDHLCRNRACVNPDHLEPVTETENIRRGAKGRLVTHCAQGHPYNEANTGRRASGHRYCLQCTRERSAAARESRRGCSPEEHAAFRQKRNENQRRYRASQRFAVEPVMSRDAATEYVTAHLNDALAELIVVPAAVSA